MEIPLKIYLKRPLWLHKFNKHERRMMMKKKKAKRYLTMDFCGWFLSLLSKSSFARFVEFFSPLSSDFSFFAAAVVAFKSHHNNSRLSSNVVKLINWFYEWNSTAQTREPQKSSDKMFLLIFYCTFYSFGFYVSFIFHFYGYICFYCNLMSHSNINITKNV